jgi:hypothetical protein
MGEESVVHRLLVGKYEGRIPLGKDNVEWRIILKWMFRNFEMSWGLDGVSSD